MESIQNLPTSAPTMGCSVLFTPVPQVSELTLRRRVINEAAKAKVAFGCWDAALSSEWSLSSSHPFICGL